MLPVLSLITEGQQRLIQEYRLDQLPHIKLQKATPSSETSIDTVIIPMVGHLFPPYTPITYSKYITMTWELRLSYSSNILDNLLLNGCSEICLHFPLKCTNSLCQHLIV